jgi:hypothetical protein
MTGNRVRRQGCVAHSIASHTSRRRFLVEASALVGTSSLPGLVACDGANHTSAETTAPSPPSPAPPAPAPATSPAPPPQSADVRAAVTFRSSEAAALVDSHYPGLSYEKDKLADSMFDGTNTALVQLFRLLGPSVLRLGANAVDRCSWNGAIRELTPILPAYIDALATFAEATEWQLIYGVNLARNTPDNAASEAAYVASRLGPSLLAWEIGNEPDLYRRHGYRPSSWSYDDYLKEWRAFRGAMGQASPGVSFSGPATAFDVAHFTSPFLRDEGARLSMLTHHYYRADRNDPTSTLASLLQPDQGLLTELSGLVPAAARKGVPLGVRLDEANSFYNGGVPNVSNAFGSALWVIDFMFMCALAGCIGVNMHGGGSGPGYTPIADRDGRASEARPELYGMLMFSQAAQGLPLEGTVNADATINLSVWGVARNDHGLNAVLINKDGTRSVRVELASDYPATRFEPLWLRGMGLSATSGHTLGGVAIDASGSWLPQAQEPMIASEGRVVVVLPPASALLLRSL